MTDQVLVDSSELQKTETAEATLALGEVFFAARKAKSLTQQDVSSTLRLSLKQIEALETDNFSALPEAMITRGFIRNYARLLELDAEPLLEIYRARVPDKSPNALSVQSSLHQVVSNKSNQSWAKYAVASILVLLCLLAWFVYMNFMPKSAKPVVQTEPVTVAPSNITTDMILPELALPAAERQADAVEVEAVTDNGNTNAADTNVTKETNVSAPVQAIVDAEPVHPKLAPLPSTSIDFNALKANAAHVATQATITNAIPTAKVDVKPLDAKSIAKGSNVDTHSVANAKTVRISVNERTWVSVTDKSGKVVFEKLLIAGSEDNFDSVPPLNVVIGNAQATKLTFSGKVVDMAAATKNNVAHLTLE